MLTTATPDNGLQLCHTSYAVRSAITATAGLLAEPSRATAEPGKVDVCCLVVPPRVLLFCLSLLGLANKMV